MKALSDTPTSHAMSRDVSNTLYVHLSRLQRTGHALSHHMGMPANKINTVHPTPERTTVASFAVQRRLRGPARAAWSREGAGRLRLVGSWTEGATHDRGLPGERCDFVPLKFPLLTLFTEIQCVVPTLQSRQSALLLNTQSLSRLCCLYLQLH